MYGGSFCYDPWELYGKELTSPNAVVIGIVGRQVEPRQDVRCARRCSDGRRGSSTSRASTTGSRRRSAFADRSPGGQVRLNPLTPRGGPERQLNLLYSVAAAALERPLTPEEKRAGQEAIVVLARRSDRSRRCPTSSTCSSIRPPRWPRRSRWTSSEIANAVRPMAFALDQLCTGNLRGMFDGPTTPGLDLDAPLVVFNLRSVLNTHTARSGS